MASCRLSYSLLIWKVKTCALTLRRIGMIGLCLYVSLSVHPRNFMWAWNALLLMRLPMFLDPHQSHRCWSFPDHPLQHWNWCWYHHLVSNQLERRQENFRKGLDVLQNSRVGAPFRILSRKPPGRLVSLVPDLLVMLQFHSYMEGLRYSLEPDMEGLRITEPYRGNCKKSVPEKNF